MGDSVARTNDDLGILDLPGRKGLFPGEGEEVVVVEA